VKWVDEEERVGGEATEKAKREFYRRASRLEGVLRVERDNHKPVAEQSFSVYVHQGDLEAEYRVYELKGELYRRYPEARLDAEVFEVQDAVGDDPDPAEIVEPFTGIASTTHSARRGAVGLPGKRLRQYAEPLHRCPLPGRRLPCRTLCL
jgi:hypothetical protein